MKIELNVMYSITMNAGLISDAGKSAVLSHIHAQEPTNDPAWIAANPGKSLSYYLPTLPASWVWSWKAERGESQYVGTFPRRLSHFYFKAYGIKCPDSFVAHIGQLARSYTSTGETYRFMVVDEFDWEDGDFGDSGSCYWGGRAAARDMMAENGGLAICFFNEDGDGYARAWMFEFEPGQYVLWNGYGMVGDATQTIAHIASQFLNLRMQRITLTNNNTGAGMLFINGWRGYGLLNNETILNAYDFRWDEPVACRDCGRGLSFDDAYTDDEGNTYCDSCFYERYEYCERCGHVHYREDIYYARGRYLCYHCKTAA